MLKKKKTKCAVPRAGTERFMSRLKRFKPAVFIVMLWVAGIVPAAAQSKSPSYRASGAFSTEVDGFINPGSFQNVLFNTFFFHAGIDSRSLDLGTAVRFGKVYTAFTYTGNVFDYTGVRLFALNMIKPAKITVKPNTAPGHLQKPLFSNKAALLIGASGLAGIYFKNIGFKFTVETLSAKHIKEELYGHSPLTVAPLNPALPLRFGFKDGQGTTVKTDGTEKSSVRIGFDWSGFRFPIGKRTLTLKPFFAVDINRSKTEAVTVLSAAGSIPASSRTEGFWDNGTTELKTFFNMSYGEFSLNYLFFYKFFPEKPQRYRYQGDSEAAGQKTSITADQLYDQTGRRDMTHKIAAAYKPAFNIKDGRFVFMPSFSLGCEVRLLHNPHTLITTRITEVVTGTVQRVKKRYIKEYMLKTEEQRITLSPATGFGFRYDILPGRLTLNTGFTVQYDYVYSRKKNTVPSISKAETVLIAEPSGETVKPPAVHPSTAQNGNAVTHVFAPKGTFGVGIRWDINEAVDLDTAFTVATDFKNAAAARENCMFAASLAIKL